jgi:hypothetical protein
MNKMFNSGCRPVARNLPKGVHHLLRGVHTSGKLISHVSQMSFIRTPLQVFFGQGGCTGTLCTPPGYGPGARVNIRKTLDCSY